MQYRPTAARRGWSRAGSQAGTIAANPLEQLRADAISQFVHQPALFIVIIFRDDRPDYLRAERIIRHTARHFQWLRA